MEESDFDFEAKKKMKEDVGIVAQSNPIVIEKEGVEVKDIEGMEVNEKEGMKEMKLNSTTPKKIFEELEKFVLNAGDVDIIKVKLHDSLTKNSKFLEEVQDIVHAERIDDTLFIKLDGGEKSEIHEVLHDSLRPQLGGWWVKEMNTCVVNGNGYLPDVGAWPNRPTKPQRKNPIVFACPPPGLWIEVCVNRMGDRDKALHSIATCIPHCPNTEFIIIAILTTHSLHPPNPNLGAVIVDANPVINNPPAIAPYIGYWGRGVAYGGVNWYRLQWNQQLTLQCGAQLRFNEILDMLT